MELHFSLAYHYNFEKLNYYIEYLNAQIEESKKDYGENIKTFSVFFTCFLTQNSKPIFTYYQGKVTKKLRTFGDTEFEDYMEVIYSLDAEVVSKLLRVSSDVEIFTYLVSEIIEAIKLLQKKYKKKTPNFKWDELLVDVPILLNLQN